ncbi:unnamed protein product [Mortierella alpina]
MSTMHRKTSSTQRTMPTGSSSAYDQDPTQANTLANRRPSVEHQAHQTKQRPITTYSSIIPLLRPPTFACRKWARIGTATSTMASSHPLPPPHRPAELGGTGPSAPVGFSSCRRRQGCGRADFVASENKHLDDQRGTLISWLRSTPLNRIVPFDKAVTFHKAIAWSIVFFSFLHTFAHYYNFYKLAQADPVKHNFWHLMFVSGPGWTGHIMLIVLVVIAATALPSVRVKKFETFWYWHHLFLVFFFFFSFHGAFCLLTPDRPPYCKDISSFWKYWVASGFIYLVERVAREWRAKQKTVISRVILHPSKVVEIQIKKDNCQALAGQYIFLCCPEVSLWQWHPFTLTSAPEEDYISIHMRVVGDFTKELSKKLGCDAEGVSEWEENLGDRNGLVTVLPRIMIDGPFGAASEDVFKYEVTVLVGAGIGVTPFASVLKSIWYRVNYPTKATKLHKVYFFWICRDKESFEWFQSLLLALESQDLNQFIEIHTFLTGRLRHSEVGNLMINEDSAFADTVTGLRARTCFGRPNLDMEFDRIRGNHPDTDIGVFFCGPKRMGKQLHACCTKFSGSGTSFFWHKENF